MTITRDLIQENLVMNIRKAFNDESMGRGGQAVKYLSIIKTYLDLIGNLFYL